MRKLRVAGVVAAAGLLGGCALPPAFQIASLALDGISYITTKKSIADHGISLLTHEDCAMLRAFQGETICADPIDTKGTMTASADPFPTTTPTQDTAVAAADSWEDLASLKPASGAPADAKRPSGADGPVAVFTESGMGGTLGKSPPVQVAELPALAAAPAPTPAPAPASTPEPAPTAAAKTVPVATPVAASVAAPVSVFAEASNGVAGTYLVVGSFRHSDRAVLMARRYADLGVQVVRAEAHGHQVFRVMLGPVAAADRAGMERKLRKKGLKNSWHLRTRVTDDRVVFRTAPAGSTKPVLVAEAD